MQSLNIEAHINNCYNTITLLSRAGSYAQFMLQPITVKCVNFSKFIIFFKRILSPAFASNHCDRSDHAIIYTHTYTYLYNKWKVITNKKKTIQMNNNRKWRRRSDAKKSTAHSTNKENEITKAMATKIREYLWKKSLYVECHLPQFNLHICVKFSLASKTIAKTLGCWHVIQME